MITKFQCLNKVDKLDDRDDFPLLSSAGELILWSPQGDEYVIIAGQDISVYKVEVCLCRNSRACEKWAVTWKIWFLGYF